MLEDCEFDRVLSEALADYYAETPDWQGVLSLKYRWRFKRMLANPFEYVKHWQERPLLKLRRYTLTAMVLLAIAGGVLSACRSCELSLPTCSQNGMRVIIVIILLFMR